MRDRRECRVNGKNGKAVPVHAIEAYGKSVGIAPLVLGYGTGWR